MSEVDRRNTLALWQAVEALRVRCDRHLAQLEGANATIASLTARVAELEQTLLFLRAAVAGRGPTVK